MTTIENVPDSIVKFYGTIIKFDYNLSFTKDIKETLKNS